MQQISVFFVLFTVVMLLNPFSAENLPFPVAHKQKVPPLQRTSVQTNQYTLFDTICAYLFIRKVHISFV